MSFVSALRFSVFGLLPLAFLTSCTRPAFVLPSGPPTPAPDGAAVWSAAAIVEALVGLPFGPRALLALLTGCSGQEAVLDAARYGDVIAVRTPDVRVYLRQIGGDWRVVASDLLEVRVEYSTGADGWPA